jgi:hypothetical protein
MSIPLQAHDPLNYTPPTFYSSFGRMPGQYVGVDAQTVTADVVQVCGRYRVGKLLGAGTFGKSI